jgi:hypothetical protein
MWTSTQRSRATGPVELEQADELERLRRRAYGPDADIAEDAAAQARLSELEAAQRRQSTPVEADSASDLFPVPEVATLPGAVEGSRSGPTSVPHPIDGVFVEHELAGGSVTVQDPAEGPTAESDPIAGVPATPWWRRRPFLILGAAVAALALYIAVVAWTSQLLADGSAPIPAETSTAKIVPLPYGQGGVSYVQSADDVLALRSVGVQTDEPNDPLGTLDALGISADELTAYEGFLRSDVGNLNVWSGESRYGLTCLLVAVPGQGLRDGLSTEGCSLKGLDTIADLRTRNSLTRFVLRGDHVNVYVYEGVADPNASHG